MKQSHLPTMCLSTSSWTMMRKRNKLQCDLRHHHFWNLFVTEAQPISYLITYILCNIAALCPGRQSYGRYLHQLSDLIDTVTHQHTMCCGTSCPCQYLLSVQLQTVVYLQILQEPGQAAPVISNSCFRQQLSWGFSSLFLCHQIAVILSASE